MWDDEVGIYEITNNGDLVPCKTYRMYRGGEVIHEQGIGQNSI